MKNGNLFKLNFFINFTDVCNIINVVWLVNFLFQWMYKYIMKYCLPFNVLVLKEERQPQKKEGYTLTRSEQCPGFAKNAAKVLFLL